MFHLTYIVTPEKDPHDDLSYVLQHKKAPFRIGIQSQSLDEL